MKNILLFGAGKSASSLINYLLAESSQNDWTLLLADSNEDLAKQRIGNSTSGKACRADVLNAQERRDLIESASIVISLLPPALHYLVAIDCVELGKNLLTASYVDQQIRSLQNSISEKGLLFLCEMGLDPGIDHMSAMKLIHSIQDKGGSIHTFRSHCGGLVAPESDDNPWHYKISWNPRNVVLAGKSGAVYKENGEDRFAPYEELFNPKKVIEIPGLGSLSYYPNRDSLSYIPVYGLESATTFIRTTLRYPEFCFGWKNVIDLKLTDETVQYETDGLSLQEFFHLHFNKYGFSEWIEKQLTSRFEQTKALLEKLQQLLDVENGADDISRQELQEFMMIDENGKLMDVNLDQVKTKAAATVAGQMHEANLSMKQLLFLGMDDRDTIINKGLCSAADVLQFALEKKLVLSAHDKDMIVMMHELGYTLNGKNHEVSSSFVLKGTDNIETAMAKTVGMPLGIAAKMILQGKLTLTGLHIPVIPEIYEPVLAELALHGINFSETELE